MNLLNQSRSQGKAYAKNQEGAASVGFGQKNNQMNQDSLFTVNKTPKNQALKIIDMRDNQFGEYITDYATINKNNHNKAYP